MVDPSSSLMLGASQHRGGGRAAGGGRAGRALRRVATDAYVKAAAFLGGLRPSRRCVRGRAMPGGDMAGGVVVLMDMAMPMPLCLVL